jgi:hypothetical protein
MAIETVRDVWMAGGKIHFRCTWGRRAGLKTVRECGFRYEIDLMTFMITRGRACLIADLGQKVRCPMCGSKSVSIGITLPGTAGEGAMNNDAARRTAI